MLPVRTKEPVTFPAEVGEKTMLNVVLAPPASVAGSVSPLMLNPVPEGVACVIVTLAVPAFCNLIVCEFGDPTTTFVKVADDGVAVIPDSTPVPVIVTVVKAGEVLLVNDMLPFEDPDADGAN